jgi:thymidylate synthase
MKFEDSTAKNLWFKTLKAILDSGEEYKDNKGRVCKELVNIIMVLNSPSENNVTEPINIITKNQEWVYPSKEELRSIMFKENQNPVYEHTYGGRIFQFGGVKNQLNDFVIPLLNEFPQSRQAVVSIFNPFKDSDLDNKNIPAMMYFQFRIKGGLLQMTAHLRSNDILIGWPANIYQLFKVQEYVAKSLDVGLGSLTTISNSAHLFVDNEHLIDELNLFKKD